MDLWEVSSGHCYIEAKNGRRPVSAQATEDGVLLTLRKSQSPSTEDASPDLSEELLEPVRRGVCCCRKHGSSGAGRTRLLPYEDLLSATVCTKEGRSRLSVTLVHCPKPKPNAGRIKEDLSLSIVVEGDEFAEELQTRVEGWASHVTSRSLSDMCRSRTGPRKFLVFVNPSSGNRAAPALWEEARCLWDSMGNHLIQYDERVTSYAGEALDYVKEQDVFRYDGIVIVSGDGLVHEVFNGLAARPDAEQALRIPIGHIPAGSGNGLATSILKSCHEDYGVLDAAFVIGKGEVQRIHLMRIHQPEKPSLVSFMTLSAAIMSDIDIESEKLRCIGPARFTAWAAYRLMNLRPLRAKLEYWPAEAPYFPQLPAPPLEEALQEDAPWKCIEDDFSLFWGSNIPWASYDACPAPMAQMSDGIWNLVIVRRSASRMQLLQCLLGFESGSHTDVANVEIIPCRAFRLTPQQRVGFLSLDGEQVPLSPIQVWPSGFSGSLLGAPPAASSAV